MSSAMLTPWHILGAAIHFTFVRRFEIDFRLWNLFAVQVVGVLFSISAVSTVKGTSLHHSTTIVLRGFLELQVGLWTSIIVHRLVWHRLRKFPGPFWAKLTRWYITWVGRSQRLHVDVQKLHSQYGDFVRVGPRELSINRVAAVPLLYGHQSPCTKGLWYGQGGDVPEDISLLGCRDKAVHKRRRRAWEKAMTGKALQSYVPRLSQKTDALIEQFRSKCQAGKPVNVSEWVQYFAFDVMGNVGLGKDFHSVENGVESPDFKGVMDVIDVVGFFGTIPWVLRMLAILPVGTKSLRRFLDYAHRQVLEREKSIDEDVVPADILSYLITSQKENGEKTGATRKSLFEDARLLITAGGDTTGSMLANSLYYLTEYPKIAEEVRKSLFQVFPNGDRDWSYDALQELPLLNQVMHETLRLSPSIPSGLTRITPPEGLAVDEVYIPGDVIVSVPTHLIHRDGRYWEDPLMFKPERWGPGGLNPETAPAYMPFTKGPGACAGKGIARMEYRMVISRILMNFELEFEDTETAAFFANNQKDTFTLKLPQLLIKLTPLARNT